MRRAADVALTVSIGLGVGMLIGYALGFTHGAPTPENSSPPPEAFDYPFGISSDSLSSLSLASSGRLSGVRFAATTRATTVLLDPPLW